MSERLKKNVKGLFLFIASLSPLLFTISALGMFPLAGRGYMYDISFPLCLIGLLLLRADKQLVTKDLSYFVEYFLPFLPFLLAYFVVYLFHRENFFSGIRISTMANMTLQCAVVYLFINKTKILNYRYLYFSGVLAVVLYFIEVLYTAISTSNSIFELKHVLPFYPSVQSECLSLLGGILLLSFVNCKRSKVIRCVLLGSATISFIIAICCIQTRAPLIVPFIVIFCVACIGGWQAFKTSGGGLLLFFIILFVMCSVSTIPSRLEMGFNEVSESLDTPTMEGLADLTSGTKVISDDKSKQQKLEVYGSSWGARLAVWKTAAGIIESNLFFGTGQGKPAEHEAIQKIFKTTGATLLHFHNDYIQTLVVGGLLLLLGYLSTILWLLIRAVRLRSVQLLSLVLSLCWFGLVDISYFNRLPFSFFMGAWTVLYYLDHNKNRNC